MRIRLFRPQHIIYDFKDDDGAQKQRVKVLPSGELPEPGEEEEEFLEVFFSFFSSRSRILPWFFCDAYDDCAIKRTNARCELDGADSLSLDAILLSFLFLSLLSLFRGEKD